MKLHPAPKPPTDGELLRALASYSLGAERLLRVISRIEASSKGAHPLSLQFDRIIDAKIAAINAIRIGAATRNSGAV